MPGISEAPKRTEGSERVTQTPESRAQSADKRINDIASRSNNPQIKEIAQAGSGVVNSISQRERANQANIDRIMAMLPKKLSPEEVARKRAAKDEEKLEYTWNQMQ